MANDQPEPFRDASAVLPAGYWRFVDVEDRLIEGMKVLMRSRDRERGWLNPGGSSVWRAVQDDLGVVPADDRPIILCSFTRQQHDRSAEAMDWVAAWVPSGPTRKVLGIALVDQVLSEGDRPDWSWIWERMSGKAGGWTTEGLRKRYSRAITIIAERLNARTSAA